MNEFWMPFATGALFVLPTLLFGYLLERIPAPSDADRLMRSERRPMYRKEHMHFLKQFRFGIIMMVVTYLLLTLLRDLRDNFAAEVWTELGYGNDAAIFTATEIPVSLLVLGLISLLVFVKNNFKALIYNHVFIISGFLISIFSTIFYQWHWISAPVWFAATGLGLYLAYVPFNCLLFDRMFGKLQISGQCRISYVPGRCHRVFG